VSCEEDDHQFGNINVFFDKEGDKIVEYFIQMRFELFLESSKLEFFLTKCS
jgi:hypothetical protein